MSQWDQLRTVELRQISAQFACPLCRGYMIDCVVAEECGHSYCRSCIARHIAAGLVTCPACHKLINPEEPGEPFDKLRADPTLQRMIYKLVPGLLGSETMQRAEYSGSEREARKDIKRSVGDKALFFNERSNVGVELKPIIEQSSSSASHRDPPSDKRFIRLELGTPLCVVIDFIKFRFAAGLSKPGIRLYQSATRSEQPLPAEPFRLIELAYLTKWDMMRPLPVYYEIINNRPADSLQPLELMPASSELKSHLDRPDRAASTSSHGQRAKQITERTASSVLRAAGRPVEQGMPPTPSTSSSSAADMKRCASSQNPPTSSSNLKLKFNKKIGGRWRLTSSSSSSSPDHDSNDVYSFPPYQPSHDNTTSQPSASLPSSSPVDEKYSDGQKPKRLQSDKEYCMERPSKVAKVLPVTMLPADEDSFPGPSKIDKVLARRDSATSLLFHTGLVPVEQRSMSRTSIGANNFSMQRILQQY